MDCIFKIWGYVPRGKFCRRCEPLEDILATHRYDKERTSKAAGLIFKAYAVLRSDDVLRDEKSRTKKAIARLVKKIYAMRLPEELNRVVEKADRTIRELEASQATVKDYVKQVSAIGGEVFEAAVGDQGAFRIGKELSSAITIQDMIKDREEDMKSGRFNPLKKIPCNKIMTKIAEISSDLGVPGLDGRPFIQRRLQTRMCDQNVGLMSSACTESIYTCLGVCGGICSALLLYRCCCD